LPLLPARHLRSDRCRCRGRTCVRPGTCDARGSESATGLGVSEPGRSGSWSAVWAGLARMGTESREHAGRARPRRNGLAGGGRGGLEEWGCRIGTDERLGRIARDEFDGQPTAGTGRTSRGQHGFYGANGRERHIDCRRDALVGSCGSLDGTGGGRAWTSGLRRRPDPQPTGGRARRMDAGVGS